LHSDSHALTKRKRSRSRCAPPAADALSLDLNDMMFSSTQAMQADEPVPSRSASRTKKKALSGHRPRSCVPREVRALADGLAVSASPEQKRRARSLAPKHEAANAMLRLAHQEGPLAATRGAGPQRRQRGTAALVALDADPASGDDSQQPMDTSPERNPAGPLRIQWGATAIRSPRQRKRNVAPGSHLRCDEVQPELGPCASAHQLSLRASLRGRLPEDVRHHLLQRTTMQLSLVREPMPTPGHVAPGTPHAYLSMRQT
jgi:hypothetical protein